MVRGPMGEPWPYRVGDYKVICDIRDNALRILVLTITVAKCTGEAQSRIARPFRAIPTNPHISLLYQISFKRIFFAIDFAARSNAKAAQYGYGWAPTLEPMLQQESKNDSRYCKPSFINGEA
jgi:hypothetical protein